jgi:hypothetical protein
MGLPDPTGSVLASEYDDATTLTRQKPNERPRVASPVVFILFDVSPGKRFPWATDIPTVGRRDQTGLVEEQVEVLRRLVQSDRRVAGSKVVLPTTFGRGRI